MITQTVSIRIRRAQAVAFAHSIQQGFVTDIDIRDISIRVQIAYSISIQVQNALTSTYAK
jgi:hypothetical protein